MYEAILSKIGLGRNEAMVYEAIVKLVKATPSQIAAHSKITRVNAYQILPKLEELGLIERINNSKTLEYIVTSPDKLMELFKNKENELTNSISELKKIILKLEPRIKLTHSKPIIKYWQGIEGVKETYHSFLDGAKDKILYGFLHRTSDPEFLKWLETEITPLRVKKNIFLNLILTDTESSRPLITNRKAEKREIKIMDTSRFPEGTYILFGKEKLMIVTKLPNDADNIGIIIEHPYLLGSMKALFDLLWED